jgi:hypothetical protein
VKKSLFITTLAIILILPIISTASLNSFNIRPITGEEFSIFVKVFSEMRGPLRVQILRDKKMNFEDADPLKYVSKVKDEKDVQKTLKDNSITWDQFTEILGNILLAYFSIQPDKTKAALVKQLTDYDLGISDSQIPAEYRQTVKEFLNTNEGAQIAGMALEFIIQIPSGNVEIVKKNKRTLDQLFYTKLWSGKL